MTRRPYAPKPTIAGENNRNSRLTEGQVLDIRRRRAKGAKLAQLAKEFGISIPHTCRIASGKMWAHLDRKAER